MKVGKSGGVNGVPQILAGSRDVMASVIILGWPITELHNLYHELEYSTDGMDKIYGS